MITNVNNENQISIYNSRDQLVVKANTLMQSTKFNLSEAEQHLIIYLVSKIKPNASDFEYTTFSISEFTKICGINDSGANCEYIKQLLTKLKEKVAWVYIGEHIRTTLNWLDQVTIDDEKAVITTKLSDSLKPYLLELHNNFTQYYLKYVLPFKSKYSIRLYEYLKSYLYRGITRISIDILKRNLCCEEQYKLWGNFKQNVLDISEREINNLSDIIFSYTVTKTGRKFTEIEFTISERSIDSRMAINAKIDDMLYRAE